MDKLFLGERELLLAAYFSHPCLSPPKAVELVARFSTKVSPLARAPRPTRAPPAGSRTPAIKLAHPPDLPHLRPEHLKIAAEPRRWPSKS